MRIRDYPSIKFFVLFLTGLLLGHNTVITVKFWIPLAFVLLTITSLFITKKHEVITTILISISIILFGWYYFREAILSDEYNEKILDNAIGKQVTLYGDVEKAESINKNRLTFYYVTDSLQFKGFTFIIREKIQVVLSLPEESYLFEMYGKLIKPGNEIILTGIFQKPKGRLYFGEYSYRDYLKSKGIRYVFYSQHQDRFDLVKEDKSIFNFSRYLNDLRLNLKSQIEKNFDLLSASYIKALIIGDRSDIPDEIKSSFVNSGVIHVLAVSGLHTGYIVLILMGIAGRFNQIFKLICVVVGLFLFSHISNLSPSVIRASIMSVVVLLSYVIQRPNNLLNSISIAGLIILFLNPLDLLNPGFQLSFGAVISIAVIYPTIKSNIKLNNLKKFWQYLVDLILISLSVSIGTFPFVVSYYERFSMISLIANLLVIPLTGVILGGIILNIFIINILPFISEIYKETLNFLINLNFQIVDWFANMPFAYKTFYNFSIYHYLIYYLMVILILIVLLKDYRPLTKLFITFCIVFNFLYHYDLFSDKPIKGKNNLLTFIETSNGISIQIIQNGKTSQNIFFIDNSHEIILSELNQINRISNRLELPETQLQISNKPLFLLNKYLEQSNSFLKTYTPRDNFWISSNIDLVFDNNKYVYQSGNNLYNIFPESFAQVFVVNDWLIIISGLKDLDKLKNKLYRFEKLCLVDLPSKKMIIQEDNLNSREFGFNHPEKKLYIFEISQNQIGEITWN